DRGTAHHSDEERSCVRVHVFTGRALGFSLSTIRPRREQQKDSHRMAKLSPEQRALVEAPNFAHFVTLMPDGSPQVTPVWVDCDDEHILINTAQGRQKPRNLARDNRVALSILDQNDPYKYIQIRGRVVEATTDGAREHIEKLARKYRG